MLVYIIGPEGIRANLEKTKTIISMVEPSTEKEVQKLTGRVAALNRFISKSAECSLLFFKALRVETRSNGGQSSQRLSSNLKTTWLVNSW